MRIGEGYARDILLHGVAFRVDMIVQTCSRLKMMVPSLTVCLGK